MHKHRCLAPNPQDALTDSPSEEHSQSHASPQPDSLECYHNNNAGTHVCVFVHGYQGVSTDLSLIKGQLAMLYPHIDMLCSKANEVGWVTEAVCVFVCV
jgi:hypothetical protein